MHGVAVDAGYTHNLAAEINECRAASQAEISQVDHDAPSPQERVPSIRCGLICLTDHVSRIVDPCCFAVAAAEGAQVLERSAVPKEAMGSSISGQVGEPNHLTPIVHAVHQTEYPAQGADVCHPAVLPEERVKSRQT